MRTGILAGLTAGIATFLLALPAAVSNADFVYMCAAGSLLDQGVLPVTPYFPAGYPLVLWSLVKLGLSALTAGILLSAVGTALTAAAVTCIARLHDVPPAVAFALGLLTVSLPSVFEISANPHLDALFTGLAAAFIALAFRLLARDAGGWFAAGAAVLGGLLLLLRFHAVLVVLPVAVVLLCGRPTARRAALAVVCAGVLAAGWNFWALNVTTGSYETAALKQVAVGAAYRDLGPRATEVVFDDYPAWLAQAPAAGTADIIDGVRANWAKFLTRKAVLLGIFCWLAVVIGFARVPSGSPLMLLFIAGYTLAVSPTYFTPRASALAEVVGLMLVAVSVGVLFASQTGVAKTSRPLPNPLVLAPVLFFLLAGAIGYNAWREAAVLRDWRARHDAVVKMAVDARELAGGDRLQVLGAIDATWVDDGGWCLPGASCSRLWLDDPLVAPLFNAVLPRYSEEELLKGEPPVAVIMLWENPGGSPGRARELALIEKLERNWVWHEEIAQKDGARLWKR